MQFQPGALIHNIGNCNFASPAKSFSLESPGRSRAAAPCALRFHHVGGFCAVRDGFRNCRVLC